MGATPCPAHSLLYTVFRSTHFQEERSSNFTVYKIQKYHGITYKPLHFCSALSPTTDTLYSSLIASLH